MPSFLAQTGSVDDMIRGVNYASAGAGIIFSSGSELVISFPLCTTYMAKLLPVDAFFLLNL